MGCGTKLAPSTYAAMRQEVLDMMKNKRLTGDCDDPYYDCLDNDYLIPVVFHVVQNQASLTIYPIADSQLENLIYELNRVFEGSHPIQTTLDPDFADLFSGNTRIRFVKAAVDPLGNPHSGIERRITDKSHFIDDSFDDIDTSTVATNSEYIVKHYSSGGLDAWPRTKYLNVWICPLYGGILGYATFPEYDLVRPLLSGVVLTDKVFGFYAPPYKLAAHEIGHWLGLLHTFTDNCTTSCGYTSGDLCEDTPTDTARYDCAITYACGHKNMNENFMDYSSCPKMFSKEQLKRMKCQLESYRSTFVLSKSCIGILSSIKLTPETGTSRVCYGNSIAIGTSSHSGFTYEWQVLPSGVASFTTTSPIANVITVTNTSPTYKGEVTILLRLKLLDSLGIIAPCGTGSWVEHKLWFGGIATAPIINSPTLSATVANVWDLCNAQRSEFTADLPGYPESLMTGVIYNWTVTGGTIIGGSGTNQIVVDWTDYGSSSIGTVKVSVVNGCGGIQSDTDYWTRACPFRIPSWATLSPNPANGYVVVAVKEDIQVSPNALSISVRDLKGVEKVFYTTLSRQTVLDIRGLKAGFYFVMIQNGTAIETLRLIVE
ncbi:MAG: T9SS C-terminal target domain-containing protein [Cytophagales bacterium]|nr:MAG: T9SS C-terminal target domain-containing protein [Cytophagales bacterium]TAF59300.1 MAG: T9SS C-terminal target domain-containing protein [Cytophagales bacterium]